MIKAKVKVYKNDQFVTEISGTWLSRESLEEWCKNPKRQGPFTYVPPARKGRPPKVSGEDNGRTGKSPRKGKSPARVGTNKIRKKEK